MKISTVFWTPVSKQAWYSAYHSYEHLWANKHDHVYIILMNTCEQTRMIICISFLWTPVSKQAWSCVYHSYEHLWANKNDHLHIILMNACEQTSMIICISFLWTPVSKQAWSSAYHSYEHLWANKHDHLHIILMNTCEQTSMIICISFRWKYNSSCSRYDYLYYHPWSWDSSATVRYLLRYTILLRQFFKSLQTSKRKNGVLRIWHFSRF